MSTDMDATAMHTAADGDYDAAAAAGAAGAADAPPQPSLFLDALPYLDQQDPQTQEQVQSLLNEEMSSLTRTPDEYLEDFLKMRGYQQEYLKFESPMLAAGFAALSAGRPAAAALDLSRYKLDAPAPPASAGVDAQIAAWRSAVDNAQAQLEHQSNRSVNLELLRKFGANAWKAHNEQLTAVRAALSDSLDAARLQVETINRKRKAEQVALGGDLELIENGFFALVGKNHEIEAACLRLQHQIDANANGNGNGNAAQASKQRKMDE